MNDRIEKYLTFNTKIGYLSDEAIKNLYNKGKQSSGWGKNAIVKINNTQIFIKKIPITKLEYEHQFDTSNLYDLPPYYNYGVGSAGINCFRELAMHIKTTNWVINGEIENFPIMYHYRIIKNNEPYKMFENRNKLNDYAKEWNNNNNIKKYMIEKGKAEHEIMIFLEYFPFTLYKWLKPNIIQATSYLFQITKIINFLKKHNIIHFDAHDGNIVSDGNNIYLTDFGLVLDMDFNLSNQEKIFFRKNNDYDYSMAINNMYSPLFDQMQKRKKYIDNKYKFDEKMNESDFREITCNNLDEIGAYFKFDEMYVRLLKKYWKLSEISPVFLYNMRHNNKKDDVFPNDNVKKLLKK